jgi:hypothetical protein
MKKREKENEYSIETEIFFSPYSWYVVELVFNELDEFLDFVE